MMLTISKKLLLGFGAVTLILIITVVTSLIAIRDIQVFSDRMINRDMPSVSDNTAISRDIYASLSALHGWVLTGQTSYTLERKAIWKHIRQLIQSTDNLSRGWRNARHVIVWKNAKYHLIQLHRIQGTVESYAHSNRHSIKPSFLTSYPIAYMNDMQANLTNLLVLEKHNRSEHQEKMLTQMMTIQNNTSSAILALQDYLISDNPTSKKQYFQYWSKSSAAFEKLWNFKGNLSESQKILLKKINLLRDHFLSLAKKVMRLRQTKQWSRATYLLVVQAEPKANKVLDLLVGSKNINGERLDGLQGEQYFSLIANTYGLSADITRLKWFVWMMLLLGTSISFIIAIITARVICRPLNQAISIAGYIAGGKRNIKIEPYTTNDEAGKLLNALDHMQTSIQKTESKLEASKQEMQYMAFHDSLTGLPNRSHLHNDFKRLLTLVKRHERNLAFLLIDLDKFKGVNDTLGHDVGDLLLVHVAKRLKSILREEDFVARLSGDEFAVILYDISKDRVAEKVSDKIVDGINKPFYLQSHEVNITVSIGIACYPAGGTDIDSLIKHADIAMYRAKQKGCNQFQCFITGD